MRHPPSGVYSPWPHLGPRLGARLTTPLNDAVSQSAKSGGFSLDAGAAAWSTEQSARSRAAMEKLTMNIFLFYRDSEGRIIGGTALDGETREPLDGLTGLTPEQVVTSFAGQPGASFEFHDA